MTVGWRERRGPAAGCVASQAGLRSLDFILSNENICVGDGAGEECNPVCFFEDSR